MWYHVIIHNEPATDEVVFSRRNRMLMVFWSVCPIGPLGVPIRCWNTTGGWSSWSEPPWATQRRDYQVVENGGRTVRPATSSDMWKEKYSSVIGVAFFGMVCIATGFLLITAAIDYRTRFLGWSIRQLPRLLDRG